MNSHAAWQANEDHLVLLRPYADLISAADRTPRLPLVSGCLAPYSNSSRPLLSSGWPELELEGPPVLVNMDPTAPEHIHATHLCKSQPTLVCNCLLTGQSTAEWLEYILNLSAHSAGMSDLADMLQSATLKDCLTAELLTNCVRTTCSVA